MRKPDDLSDILLPGDVAYDAMYDLAILLNKLRIVSNTTFLSVDFDSYFKSITIKCVGSWK